MKKVYLNFKLSEEELERLRKISDELVLVTEREYDVNAIIGKCPPDKLKEYENLEWYQSLAIGVDAYINKGVLKEGTVLTNARGVHSQEVAEHIFGMVVTLLKNFELYRDNQRENLWHDEGVVKSYKDLKVTIVGFGDIGNHLAKMMKAMGMYIIGVKRTMIDKPDYVDELYTSKDLIKAVSDVDVVVTVVPGDKANEHLFTLDTFKAMRRDTIFVNAGRGNLYTEETLYKVLDDNIVKAVGLDVFEKEPLDKDSRLWNYRNVLITPHVAGFFHLESAHDDFVDLVEENLRRYINGEELKFTVKERE